MRKQLTKNGHSWCLIIDKSLRRLMSLGPSRVVDITTDGRRLVVTPVPESEVTGAPPEPPRREPFPEALALDAKRVCNQLVHHFAMSEAHFLALFPTGRRLLKYFALVDYDLQAASSAEQRAVRRFAICCSQLEAGLGWPEAIAVARYAIPEPN